MQRPEWSPSGFARALTVVAALAVAAADSFAAEVPARVRPSLVLENGVARVVVDLAGGSIGEFRLKTVDLNPLDWGTPGPSETKPRAFGHFLCLDRWGPPSEAEGARGMPYHGEATHVPWTLAGEVTRAASGVKGIMSAQLPIAGLTVRRSVRLAGKSSVFEVVEEVTNTNPLGRVLNLVQHPTIAPPFLDPSTRVDCNGRRGFAQGGELPDPEKPETNWPVAIDRKTGSESDLRRLGANPEPNVASFAIDAEWGWITASSPTRGLLIGYAWRTSDYPWVSVWRDVREGRPSARGLEFGTTGLHQPFAALTRKGRIFERPLFEYLDAGASLKKAYLAFLLPIPGDFAGVGAVEVAGGRITIREQAEGKGRSWELEAPGGE
jgi:hypothetical protein